MSHGYTLLRQRMAHRLSYMCVEESAWLRAPLTLVRGRGRREYSARRNMRPEVALRRNFEDLNEFMTIGVGVSPFHSPEFA